MIHFSEETTNAINSAMMAGNYQSEEEFILDAIEAWKIQRLNEEIQKGLDQLDRGDGKTYSRDRINELVKSKLAKR